MSKMTNANKLCEQFGLQHKSIRKLLDEHLTPLMEMPYGKGVLKMYDEEAAVALVREHYDVEPPEPEVPGAVDLSSVTTTLAAMTKTLNGIALNQSGTEDACEAINERLTKIDDRTTQQHALLFKELQGIHAQLKAFNDALGHTPSM